MYFILFRIVQISSTGSVFRVGLAKYRRKSNSLLVHHLLVAASNKGASTEGISVYVC